MWGKISRHWQVIAATLFSIVLVVGAFMFARGVESPQVAQASDESALLQAIAKKDSDSDGLPDWEEALYGTDSHVVDTFKLGMTDGAAVAQGLIVPKAIANVPIATSSPTSFDAAGLPQAPADGTLTAQFAQSFFSLYLTANQNAGSAGLSETDLQNVATQAISQLSSSIKPASDFKSASDLTVSGSGAEALKKFAASAEAVLLKNTSDATDTDINYLKAALENNDTAAMGHIASIAKMYRGSAAGLAALSVPKELATADLALINTLMRLSEIDADFTRVDTDPLTAILAVQQYGQVTAALGEAFVAIGKVYATANVTLPKGVEGASFVNMISEVNAAKQTATKNP
ncbi:MAG: hypothetical protein WCW36_00335 [Candidatus Paceibacterota bacterium]